MKHTSARQVSRKSMQKGFTLVQLLVVLGIIAVLSAILIGFMGSGRAAARRVQCDTNLKGIAMALDTFRQENGRLPKSLAELRDKYVPTASLRCASDPDLKTKSADAAYASYEDFYIIREPRDSGELPVVVCPFHEGEGQHGAQAYKGRYTAQFSTQPATLLQAGANTTVTRPGKDPIAAYAGMPLRGGDRIKAGGETQIKFADGSVTTLSANSDIKVLQSYIEGQSSGPLYTLVRQFAGTAKYNVVTGNRFDVATPTATAGALGTEFTVVVDGTSSTAPTKLTVTESAVALTTTTETVEVITGDPTIEVDQTGKVQTPPGQTKKERKPRNRGKKSKD
ncbi:MAG TPA: FecR domain-containing protein [Abditibacteriaceae bacterium]